MIKRFIFLVALILSPLYNYMSAQDTARVRKTKIDIVYNHYIQNGDNSAITGGIGSERLTVYGPSMGWTKQWNNKTVKVNMGVDIISSVSTDNIDFVMSSASALDGRSHVNSSYQCSFSKGLTIYGGGGLSIESDYFSIGSKIGVLKENLDQLSQFSAEFQMYYDDLRWGRLSIGSWRPEKLIYPEELRHKEWHTVYRRNSYNLKLGYSKAINKRSILGLYPVVSYQNGLLSTPYHRIYFSDDTQAVEKLPEHRYKISIGLRWNHFIGGRYVVKSAINPYMDNWGVQACSIDNETAIKLDDIWTLLPNGRIYVQKGSPYFAAYKQHKPSANFYTSDYDLATNKTYSLGMGVKFAPHTRFFKNLQFNTMMLRYNFLYRENGLYAHILALAFQWESE